MLNLKSGVNNIPSVAVASKRPNAGARCCSEVLSAIYANATLMEFAAPVIALVMKYRLTDTSQNLLHQQMCV